MKKTNTTNQANTYNTNLNVKEQNTMKNTNNTLNQVNTINAILKDNHIQVITSASGKTRKKQSLTLNDFKHCIGLEDGYKVYKGYIARIEACAKSVQAYAENPDGVISSAVKALQAVFDYLTTSAGVTAITAQKMDVKYIIRFNARRKAENGDIIVDDASRSTYQRLIEDCIHLRLNGLRPNFTTLEAKTDARRERAKAKREEAKAQKVAK